MSPIYRFPKSVPALRVGTGEPPLALTDVSLRQGRVVQGWPVPSVPCQFPSREPMSGGRYVC